MVKQSWATSARVSALAAVVAAIIAAGSIALNLTQLAENRALQRREATSLEAFYVMADDNTLMTLFEVGGGIDPPGEEPSITLVVDSALGRETRTFAEQLRKQTEGSLRRYPVASFLMLHNTGTEKIADVTVRAQGQVTSLYYSPPNWIDPGQWQLVPLDLRVRGKDFEDPALAPVSVAAQGIQPTTVTRGKKFLWLKNQFIRAMIRMGDE